MKKPVLFGLSLIIGVALMGIAQAATAPYLGAAGNFRVFDINTQNATQARSDLASAYNQLGSQSCTSNLTNQTLGGRTVTPGVYCLDTYTNLNGNLFLDAGGDSNAVFIFRFANGFSVDNLAQVLLMNNAQWQNVFWQVVGSANVRQGTLMKGNLFANGNIMLQNGASITGRVQSLNGIVDANLSQVSIYCPFCSGDTTGTGGNGQYGNATLTVITQVTNNNGGQAVPSDFIIHIDGRTLQSGVPTSLTVGTYRITEVNVSPYNYFPPYFSGDCTADGTITLSAGTSKTCVITNDDTGGTVSGAYYPGVPNTGGGQEGITYLLVAIAGVLGALNILKAYRHA